MAASAAAIAAAVQSPNGGGAAAMAHATRAMLAVNMDGFARRVALGPCCKGLVWRQLRCPSCKFAAHGLGASAPAPITCNPCNPHVRREVVERLVREGNASAVGRLCVAAVQLGPEQADAIRQLSVQLLAAGSTDTAAAVAAAFWDEAAAAGAQPAAEPRAAAPAAPEGEAPAAAGPAASLAEAAQSELTAWVAALQLEPGAPAGGATAEPAGGPVAESAAAGVLSPAAGNTPSLPPAAQPTAAELQQGAAVVLAAAVVEAVQLGHTGAVVAVTEQLMASGHQEMVRALVATMVEAGGWRRALGLRPAACCLPSDAPPCSVQLGLLFSLHALPPLAPPLPPPSRRRREQATPRRRA